MSAIRGLTLPEPRARRSGTASAGRRRAASSPRRRRWASSISATGSGLFDFTDVQYRSPVTRTASSSVATAARSADLEARVDAWSWPAAGCGRSRAASRASYGNLDGYALRGHAVRRRDRLDHALSQCPADGRRDRHRRGHGADGRAWRARHRRWPIPYAEGAQDQYLSLLMRQAAETSETVRSTRQPWAGQSSSRYAPLRPRQHGVADDLHDRRAAIARIWPCCATARTRPCRQRSACGP